MFKFFCLNLFKFPLNNDNIMFYNEFDWLFLLYFLIFFCFIIQLSIKNLKKKKTKNENNYLRLHSTKCSIKGEDLKKIQIILKSIDVFISLLYLISFLKKKNLFFIQFLLIVSFQAILGVIYLRSECT